MPSPPAHLYDLALRALDEQDRRADALRGRLGPVLAAAALGVSLLSAPVIGDARPVTAIGKLALAVSVAGLLVSVTGALRLVAARRRPADDVDPWELTGELERRGLLDDEAAFYEAMIARLARLHARRLAALARLASTFTAMLWGILVMLCGLALAAIVG